MIVLTKVDTLSNEDTDKFVTFFEEQLQKKVLPISGVSHYNLDILKPLIFKMAEVTP